MEFCCGFGDRRRSVSLRHGRRCHAHATDPEAEHEECAQQEERYPEAHRRRALSRPARFWRSRAKSAGVWTAPDSRLFASSTTFEPRLKCRRTFFPPLVVVTRYRPGDTGITPPPSSVATGGRGASMSPDSRTTYCKICGARSPESFGRYSAYNVRHILDKSAPASLCPHVYGDAMPAFQLGVSDPPSKRIDGESDLRIEGCEPADVPIQIECLATRMDHSL